MATDENSTRQQVLDDTGSQISRWEETMMRKKHESTAREERYKVFTCWKSRLMIYPPMGALETRETKCLVYV